MAIGGSLRRAMAHVGDVGKVEGRRELAQELKLSEWQRYARGAYATERGTPTASE